MTHEVVESLAQWGNPKEVQTKRGPRYLRKARVTAEFSEAWKTHKDELKAYGAVFSKNQDGDWGLCWWLEIPADEREKRKASLEASHATSAEIDLPCPAGLKYMPFQKAGIRYALDRPGVLFADEMGLGKTVEAIGVINADESIKSVIIVCPKSLKLNWKRELGRWLSRPMSVGITNGNLPPSDIVILNYEALTKLRIEKQYDMCIVDEAHFIKSKKAKRSKAVKAIKARRQLRLTGTPIVNRPVELQNLVDDLNPAFQGWGFLKRYCNAKQNSFGWDFSGASNLDELQTRLRETIMVRRLKSEVLTELPRKIRQVIELDAETEEQKQAVKSEEQYEARTDEELVGLRINVELAKAENGESYEVAVAKLKEAIQVRFSEISRLRHETALAKLPQVVEHLGLILNDTDTKIVVAAHHHDVVAKLQSVATERGWYPVILTGESKESERQESVDKFQNDPRVRLFIGSITAAGVGITLTASSHVVFAELDWVPGNISQFEDRTHRIGQTEAVLVQHLVLSGSLDARMVRVIVEKQRIIDEALDIKHPARSEPVYEPRESAASHSVSKAQIEELSKTMTPEKAQEVHQALRRLASVDTDYAATLNGIGFNKIDTAIGHSLAKSNSLSPKQAALGWKIIQKYTRQLNG